MIVVIGCGKAKLPYAAAACRLYVGSYFQACLRAAEVVAPGQVFILSAKYGLVTPETCLHPYDLTFGQPGSVTAKWVARQAAALGIADEPVTALCGDRYASLAREVWPHVESPLAGLGIGQQLQKLTRMMQPPS